MDIKILSITKNWLDIKNAALNTIGKQSNKEPTSEWKRRILLCEHSPIRKLKISWKWINLKYWVSVHIVRHKIGIEHFVTSQRNDRQNKYDRDKTPQSALITHECEANAQAIINISRKRLCNQASKETREAWQKFLDSFKDDEPELYSVCVPECIYRNGLCPEFKTCGWNKTLEFENKLKQYIKGIESQINPKTNINNRGVIC